MISCLLFLLLQNPSVVILPDPVAQARAATAQAERDLAITEANCARADLEAWKAREAQSAALHRLARQEWERANDQWFIAIAQHDPAVLLHLLAARMEARQQELILAGARHRQDATDLAAAQQIPEDLRDSWRRELAARKSHLESLRRALHRLQQLAKSRQQLREAAQALAHGSGAPRQDITPTGATPQQNGSPNARRKPQ